MMNQPSTVDISGFNRGMTGFVDKLGLSAPVVLKKEMGELLKTLIRTTPPKNPTKTRASISDTVSSRFEAEVVWGNGPRPIVKSYRPNGGGGVL